MSIRIPAFEPRDYQLPFLEAMDDGCKRAVLVWHRRAGKEVACWNFLIKQAYWHRVGTYIYFFPTSKLGRRILWDGADKTGKRFLHYIPKDIIDGEPNSVEMKVRLKNGSLIQIMGTDSIINVGINPVGAVFSEYSLQSPQVWEFIRPIFLENEGWAVFNFCVKEDTLVLTKNGMQEIKDVVPNSKEGFSDISLPVYGLNGCNTATNFYNGGSKKLVKITTQNGYTIECTPNHPIFSIEGKWKNADQWKVGECIPIQRGQNCFGDGIDISQFPKPKKRKSAKDMPLDFKMDEDLAYLLGLILSEGNWNKNTLTITNGDKEIHDFLISRGFRRSDDVHFNYCSQEFISFIEWMGLKRGAKNKDIPRKILLFPKIIVSSFLAGYFDGDGCATKRGLIHCDSVSEKLINDLQIILLNYGIISRKSFNITKPTKKVKVFSKCFRLELNTSGSFIFFRDIKFRLSRKQSRKSLVLCKSIDELSDQIPITKQWSENYCKKLNMGWLKRQKSISYRKAKELQNIKYDPWLESVINTNYFYDKIKTIESSEGHVYDFVIPETHSFFSNGFISHNTPRGKNHAYDLFQTNKDNPDWFVQKLTIENTGVLTKEHMDRERREGMSDIMIQQEYYCSFDQGVEGAYYAKLLDKADMDGRICKVPYDPAVPVDTFWDLGVSDATCILFTQNCGNEVHLIDMFQSEGEGLQYYARIIKEKAEANQWVYGEHYAPNDIMVRELGSGAQTRLQIAKDLGIKFNIVPNIPIVEGIELGRNLFHKLWVDKEKCRLFLKCAENYHKTYNERLNVYSDKPCHDFSSHCMDAYRMLAIMQSKRRSPRMTEEEAEKMQRLYTKKY